MGLLAWTSSAILIFSLLSYALFNSLAEQRAFTSYLSHEISSIEGTSFANLFAKTRYVYFQKSKDIPSPPDLPNDQKSKIPKPRLTSKVHITPATFTSFKETPEADKSPNPGGRLLYNLLKRLYPGIGALLDTSDNEAITLIMNALAEAFVRYEGKFSSMNAVILANFELQDSRLQECLWNMLHGRKKGKEVWPSLISFISFKKESFLTSLWLSPKVVLESIFEDEEVIKELLQKREEIYSSQRKKENKQSDQATQMEADWRALCEQKLPSWLPSTMVDLRISKTKPSE